MCGLFGIVTRAGQPLPAGCFARAARLLRHRGPDEATALSFLRDGGEARLTLGEGEPAPDADLGFVFRRLSIIDLSSGGRQPRRTPDGRFHLMFNGEIYNYRELRAELAAAGHRFASQSDSEVLLAALAAWGEAALARLVGMFALAFHDRQTGQLWLARDFAGIKPLYYVARPDCFAFASEPRALLELPGVGRAADAATLASYLSLGATDRGEATFLAGIRRLPAASSLRVDLSSLRPDPPCAYWRPPEVCPRPMPEAAERLRQAFLQSVALHLRSDVAVGVALSGGIDSTAIVMAIRRHLGQEAPPRAFAYVAGGAFDEEPHAALAAQAAGLALTRIAIQPGDLARDLPALIAAQGEPFASTSIYAQYRVFQAAREAGVKVMLGGQGADELLAGYAHFVPTRLVGLLASGRPGAAARLVAGGPLPAGGGRVGLLARGLAGLLPAGWREAVRRPPPGWLARQWRRTAVPAPAFRDQVMASFTTDSLPALLR
ncbi:MAG: asparagine synthase (glutamine-hydrolyzing), partial [Alphaproteobacteria bacterium]|nr:asparagine synthase (glutamine-hydrolyzing) [Alphaproteobacteria bacterium]